MRPCSLPRTHWPTTTTNWHVDLLWGEVQDSATPIYQPEEAHRIENDPKPVVNYARLEGAKNHSQSSIVLHIRRDANGAAVDGNRRRGINFHDCIPCLIDRHKSQVPLKIDFRKNSDA